MVYYRAMDLSSWIAAFRDLHGKARAGRLAGTDIAIYMKGRNELARALVAAQRLTLKPGETPRQALRVAKALQIDLDLAAGRVRAMTLDLSIGGFSALVGRPPAAGVPVGFSLRMPGGGEPLAGRCRLIDAQNRPGNSRIACAFEGLTPEAQERIELVVFDAVVEQFKTV